MSIEKFISKKTQQKAEAEEVSESVTLRLPSSVVGDIDDLASSLDVTRHELITEFVNDSLKRGQKFYEEVRNKPDFVDLSIDVDVDVDSISTPRYIFLNTNRRNDLNDHTYMVSNGIAAAYYDPWKFKIDKLRKGDVVFLYASGIGIVGVGKANGKTEILDRYTDVGETHQQKLTDYRNVAIPLNARKIKKLIGINLCYMQTMFKVKSSDGVLIEQQLT